MEGSNAPLGLRKGAWTSEEDILLREYILKNGEGNWHLIPKKAGINRCRKSCRLRWVNYLSPNIKRGTFADDEIDLIIKLHNLLGNRWSLIAGRIPGRTANDVKNFWNSPKFPKSNFTNKRANDSLMFNIPEKAQPIRPQTHTFKKSLIFVNDKYVTLRSHDNMIQNMDFTINADIIHENQGNTTALEPLYKEMENNIPSQKDMSNEEGDDHNWQQYPCLDAEMEQDGTLFDQITDWSDMLMLENINVWSLLEDEENVC